MIELLLLAVTVVGSGVFVMSDGTTHRVRRLRAVSGFRSGPIVRWLNATFPTFTRRFTDISNGEAGGSANDASSGQGTSLHHVRDLLYAGFSPAQAWASVGVVTDSRGVPLAPSVERTLGAGIKPRPAVSNQYGRAIVAACEIALQLGSPLGPALSAVDRALCDERVALEEQAIVLAGPVTSSLLLQFLPLVGLALALILGANPLVWFVQSPAGACVGLCGIGFLVGGRAWTKRLITAARRQRES